MLQISTIFWNILHADFLLITMEKLYYNTRIQQLQFPNLVYMREIYFLNYLQRFTYFSLEPPIESSMDTVLCGTLAAKRIQWFAFLFTGMNIQEYLDI